MMDKGLWPDLLQRLKDLNHHVHRLGGMQSAEYELYLVDFSDWKLRLSERTPLIWVKAAPAQNLSVPQLCDSLKEVVKANGWQRVCFVLFDGDGKELRKQTNHQYFPRFIIIDIGDQHTLLSTRVFTRDAFLDSLKDLVCSQVPISALYPYQISDPVSGSRFFGREREIANILGKSDASFAITGVRRIGKTSLLNEIERRMVAHGEDPGRLVRLDVTTIHSPDEFVREVVRKLNIREFWRLEKQKQHLYFPNFLQRMSKTHRGRLTILLDEVDPFLTWARAEPYLMSTLRASVHTGDCRYIVAGFQVLLRELADHDSPFFQAFERVNLKPFNLRDTRSLVLDPMESLRVKFENKDEVVSRIHSDTQGHPRLIQFYCSRLIDELENRENRTISLQSLTHLYASDEFKAEVRNSFRDNTGTREKLLIYTMLASFPEGKESFTQEEMFGALKRHNCFIPADDLDRICEHLVLIGVLVCEGQRYEFAMPIFPRTMRANENLDYLVAVTKREAQQ